MNFKVGILQISTSQDVPLELPLWVENLKDTDFEIHNLFLFLTVLGDHWELEARTGTVGKLSFHTFRKQKHFSFLKTFFGWKMWKTNRPLPQNTTFSECELATSKSKWSNWPRIIEIQIFAQFFSSCFESYSTFPSSGCKTEVFGRWMPYGWMIASSGFAYLRRDFFNFNSFVNLPNISNVVL